MIEIGRSKRAQPVFAFDDIAIVPTRRTRGEEQVNLTWRIDAFTFDFPIVAAPMDSVMSPATAIAMGRLGGLGVLNLEGLWTRYDDPEPLLEEMAEIDDPGTATRRMQELYAEPIKEELISQRVAEIRSAGVPVAGALSPQNTQAYAGAVVDVRGGLLRHPRHDGLGRARRRQGGAAQPEAVHLRPRRARSSSAAAPPTRRRCT